MRVQQLDVPLCTLGEGPVWSDRDGCLYYLDIVEHRLQAYTPSTGQHRAWTFPTFTGSLAECRSGGLIVSLGHRIVRFDPQKGLDSLEELCVLEADRPLNRLNDGKVDPWGRFWVGSMRIAEDASEGRLWCVEPSGAARSIRDGIGVSNSLAFDRERERIYFADSMTGVIECADFDAAHTIESFRPFVKAGKGAPDGSCTDAAGYLWNAEWGGHRVCRYAPDGSLERVLEMPISRPSCCTFGGPSYRTLFVTTARYNMTPDELARDPNAGALFSIELDDSVEGLPADLFGSP
ncbi:MAG TPA: SMP-30/gluconolactonase/LRE family protein [Polyangiaceae bacterium]|nr:SMP-30/gluconolactonase/LRE family protein [Polyangiaceae bacterium]